MKKSIISALMSCTLLSSVSSAAAEPSIDQVCARSNVECLTSDAGVVIGRPGSTAVYAANIDTAAKRFERYFGMKAPKAAVVLGEVGDQDIREGLLTLFPVVLPWLTIQDREDMIARSVRAQVQKQLPDLGGDALDAVVARSVKASLGDDHGSGDTTEDVHQGVLAHELGHLFFIQSFWPTDELNVMDTPAEDIERYAGPAPDWLDEMAAILMENKARTADREDSLKTMVSDDNFSAIWPLESYFNMIHPVFEQARRLIKERQKTAEGQTQGGVVILSRGNLDVRDDGRTPAMFYAQSRGFADYMIEKTDDVRIFAKISKHIADGGAMNSWLSQKGSQYGIPTTVDALESDFKSWLKTKYKAKVL